MTKVLAVVPTPYVFGLQEVTLSYFGSLSPEVHSHFLLTRWSDGEFARRLDALQITYSHSWLGMFSRRLDRTNLRMTLHCMSKLPVLYYSTSKLIRQFHPDVILVANYHELILLFPILRLCGIPILCHMHDPPPSQGFYKRVAKIWDSLVTRYIAISSNVVARMESLGIPPSKIMLLHNGVLPEHISTSRKRKAIAAAMYGWPPDSVVIGMTGQMHERKGHLDLIEAAAEVCAHSPQARFMIGGKGDGPYAFQLRERIAHFHLEDKVVLAGWQADVRDFYASIDLFVLPSRHEEGFGMVVAEAMAAGLPVIATRSGGVIDLVQDKVTGHLVDRQAPTQLAQAINLLIGSEHLRKTMGAASRDRVEIMFSHPRQTRLFEEVLHSAASTNRE